MELKMPQGWTAIQRDLDRKLPKPEEGYVPPGTAKPQVINQIDTSPTNIYKIRLSTEKDKEKFLKASREKKQQRNLLQFPHRHLSGNFLVQMRLTQDFHSPVKHFQPKKIY
jgi:hypothetical protein